MNDFATIQRTAFHEEAQDLLAGFELTMLDLEKSPTDLELLNSAFRNMHTIKGSGAMCGYLDLSEFVHELENMLDQAREGKITLGEGEVDLALEFGDHLKHMLNHYMHASPIDTQRTETLQNRMRKLCGARHAKALPKPVKWAARQPAARSGMQSGKGPGKQPVTQPAAQPAAQSVPVVGKKANGFRFFHILFHPDPAILERGLDPLILMDELSDLGRVQYLSDFSKQPTLEDLNPLSCNVNWEIWLLTKHTQDRVKEVFAFVIDESVLELKEISLNSPQAGGRNKLLQPIADAVSGGVGRLTDTIPPEQKQSAAAKNKQTVQAGGNAPATVISISPGPLPSHSDGKAYSPQASSPGIGEGASPLHEENGEASMAGLAGQGAGRITPEQVGVMDRMIATLGNMMAHQYLLTQFVEPIVPQDEKWWAFGKQMEQMMQDVCSIAEVALNRPLATVFDELETEAALEAKALGREVEFVFTGGVANLPRHVTEALHSPLSGLIRNALMHGIASPKEREEQGLSPKGTIMVNAKPVADGVEIKVEDDGVGLDLEAIQARIAKDLPGFMHGSLSESEQIDLLFTPGFSTSKFLHGTSGRADGLSRIRQEIQVLGGNVALMPRPEGGVCARIFLTRGQLFFDTMAVESAGRLFALPFDAIQTCRPLGSEELAVVTTNGAVPFNGASLPCVRLREGLGAGGAAAPQEHLVVCSVRGQKLGVVVDNVLGPRKRLLDSTFPQETEELPLLGISMLAGVSMAWRLDLEGLLDRMSSLREIRGGDDGVAEPPPLALVAHG